MSDLMTQWRRKSKDQYFMLSVYGLCFMALPLVIVVFVENFAALSSLTWGTPLQDAGIHFRSVIATISRCESVMIGVGIVTPAFGLVLVVIAWTSIFIRRFISKPRLNRNVHPEGALDT